MGTTVHNAVAVLLLLFFSVVLPSLSIWGWVRWTRRRQPREFASISSLIALSLATASALLAIGGIAYAHATGGFPYYDPRLLKVYRLGFLLSIGAILFSVSGLLRPNVLRWHALVCAVGTALFWIAAAEGE